MDINGNYEQINRLATKKELLEYIEKRFTTSFIGALDSVESHMYDLFTEDEWKMYWLPLREEILNKGNSQKRLAMKKLDEYEFRKLNKRKDENYNR